MRCPRAPLRNARRGGSGGGGGGGGGGGASASYGQAAAREGEGGLGQLALRQPRRHPSVQRARELLEEWQPFVIAGVAALTLLNSLRKGRAPKRIA